MFCFEGKRTSDGSFPVIPQSSQQIGLRQCIILELDTERMTMFREEVVKKLKILWRNFVQDLMQSEKLTGFSVEEMCDVHSFGSYALDIHLMKSDIDLICVASKFIERADFELRFIIELKMNKEKTKIMSNSDDVDYKINDWCIEKVEEFKYLGQILSFKNKMSKTIDDRVSAAWRTFWALKKFLISKLPMYHKRKLMDSVILPVLTYGAQTWTLTCADERRLQAEQKAMERRILKISLLQHETNESIRNITKIKDVLEKARELKWDWAGHVQRMPDDRWTKSIENWNPKDGKRNRGHQLKRWRDDIKQVGLGRWRTKAEDRKLWKNLRETYVQKD